MTKILDYPVDRLSPISQYFGDNPSSYAKFGLLGHNGIDFAVAQGTPVTSCADGKIIECAMDINGYGLYIKISHEWGESIYGHLSEQSVTVNQYVARGDLIGKSGNTGNSTGPHLHFGIRISPYSRSDGWNGHTDPYPYLTDRDNTSIIGVHTINSPSQYMDKIEKLRPAIVLMLDPSQNDAREIKLRSPNTKIIGRIYKPDSEVANLIKSNPQNAAQLMHQAVLNHPAFQWVDYWQGWVNEVCQVDWNEFGNLVKCETERMRLAQNYKCAIFAFSVGQPDLPSDNRMAYWKATYTALDYAEKNGHIVCLHQYGCKPNIWGPEERGGPDWLIHRLEHQVLKDLPFKKLKFAVTEFGHDYMIVSGPASSGGYKARPDYKDNVAEYAEDLINIGEYLSRYKGRVLGYAVFTLGHNSPWESYDIAGTVLDRLANHTSSNIVDIDAKITQVVNDNQLINVNPGAALTKVALTQGLTTQVSQEVEIENSGIIYIAAKFEDIATGKSSIFYVEKGKWQQVKEIRLK